MDLVIFTGRMDVEELKEDKPLEYEQMVKSGKIEENLGEAYPPIVINAIRFFGWTAVVIGLSVVVYVLWYWLLKHMDASRVAVYHNIQPILASTVAYLFLGETLSAAFIAGGTVVILGVVVAEV